MILWISEKGGVSYNCMIILPMSCISPPCLKVAHYMYCHDISVPIENWQPPILDSRDRAPGMKGVGSLTAEIGPIFDRKFKARFTVLWWSTFEKKNQVLN